MFWRWCIQFIGAGQMESERCSRCLPGFDSSYKVKFVQCAYRRNDAAPSAWECSRILNALKSNALTHRGGCPSTWILFLSCPPAQTPTMLHLHAAPLCHQADFCLPTFANVFVFIKVNVQIDISIHSFEIYYILRVDETGQRSGTECVHINLTARATIVNATSTLSHKLK